MAVTAANLNHLENTKSDLGNSVSVARTAAGVTVEWVTDYDPLLGGQTVVGATLVANDGAALDDASIDLTIVGADGTSLGTISSTDGGETWSPLTEPVAVSDSLVASVLINDHATTAAISDQ